MGTTLLTRVACYLSGHDHTIRQAGGRMFLYCETCGHRTDGIVLTGRVTLPAPKTARGGTPRPHATQLPTGHSLFR
jgi:hypothetical protein